MTISHGKCAKMAPKDDFPFQKCCSAVHPTGTDDALMPVTSVMLGGHGWAIWEYWRFSRDYS